MYFQANVYIKRAVFVGIHTLVTHSAFDKCTKKDHISPFAFVSHCALLVDFSGFFFTRNDRGMLIVSSGSLYKQNTATSEL